MGPEASMGMIRLGMGLLCMAVLPSVVAAAPQFRGQVRLFEITQPHGLRRVVPAVEQNQTAHGFYDYRSASSHTGYERARRSILFLHRDLRDDALSLIITHGIDNIGQPMEERQPGSSLVRFDLEGVPEGARVTQADDGPSEFGLNRQPEGVWSFGDNTDGGVLSSLPIDRDWSLTITPLGWNRIDDWGYHFADGSDIFLDMEQAVTLQSRGETATGDTIEADEGVLVTVCAFVEDARPGDPLTYIYDWADGGQQAGATTASELFCEEHVYADDGRFEIRITVTNAAGEEAAKVITAFIGNQPPVIESVDADPAVEGQPIPIQVVATDPGTADVLLYSVDCDQDGNLDVMQVAADQLVCLFSDDGTYQPRVTVEDDDGGLARANAPEITVRNGPPTVEPVFCPATTEGQRVTIDLVVGDPAGANDTVTCHLAEPLAEGVEMDAARCRITWTPTHDQALAERVVIYVDVRDEDGGVTSINMACQVELPDQDGDGRGDVEDNCPTMPNPDQADGDRDQVGDLCDLCPLVPGDLQVDADDDGHGPACDNCPDEFNPDQSDRDADGHGDLCDNCLDRANADQRDEDADGLGDACDAPDEVPEPEICDGLDNDLDGEIDEDVPERDACGTGQLGVCGAGTERCVGWEYRCVSDTEASAEICDGLDNDCDGATDEASLDAGEPCATEEPGICAIGHTACVEGHMDCTADHAPELEICNGIDDNCDGEIDEGLRNRCGTCESEPVEICDGADNDCDGETDEGALCDGPSECAHGRCLAPCEHNECPFAEVCFDGLCIDPCDQAECAGDERCEEGLCVDPCAEVDCGAGEICVDGECQSDHCFYTGCPPGQRCRESVCEPDPCHDRRCPEASFCRDGACIASCGRVSCAANDACVDGACVPNPCFDAMCANDEVCVAGQCGPNACADVTCDFGMCEDGNCRDDPCWDIECPPAEICAADPHGSAQCVPDPDQPLAHSPPDSGPDGPPDPFDGGHQGDDCCPQTDAGRDVGADASETSDGTLSRREVSTGLDADPFVNATGENSEPVDCSCRLDGQRRLPWVLALLLLPALLRLRRRATAGGCKLSNAVCPVS